MFVKSISSLTMKHLFVLCSLVLHVFTLLNYPFTFDEIHIFNMLSEAETFNDFWKFFVKHDTHLPLFYLLSYIPSKLTNNPVLLRMIPFSFYILGLFAFNKKFNTFKGSEIIAWSIFLFSPYLVIYSIMYKSYSVLIPLSIVNYLYLDKCLTDRSKVNLITFVISSILLCATHYFGIFQVILTFGYLATTLVSRSLWKLGIPIVSIMLFFLSDLWSDFFTRQGYAANFSLIDFYQQFGLVLGGLISFSGIIAIVVYHNKEKLVSCLKSKEAFFVIVVVTVSLLRSFFIAPSYYGRYYFIIFFPLMILLTSLKISRKFQLLLATAVLFSNYSFFREMSPKVGINFSSYFFEEAPVEKVGLLITPCPKMFFSHKNYVCKTIYDNQLKMVKGVDSIIVHEDHLPFFKSETEKIVRNIGKRWRCKHIGGALYRCRGGEIDEIH